MSDSAWALTDSVPDAPVLETTVESTRVIVLVADHAAALTWSSTDGVVGTGRPRAGSELSHRGAREPVAHGEIGVRRQLGGPASTRWGSRFSSCTSPQRPVGTRSS